jgi:cysteine dioxygenase
MSLSELVDRLGQLIEADPRAVGALLADASVGDECLAPYVTFLDDEYARTRVQRSELFDVLVLCWRPGQRTEVHNHSGQHGWVRVLRGRLEEEAFEPDRAAARAETTGDAACDSLVRIRLRPTTRAVVDAGAGVVTVDPLRNIHRIGNPGEVNAVSLHVYSKPHDSCLVYDLEAGTCRRKELD